MKLPFALLSLFMGLALLAGVYPVLSQSTLNIAPASQQSVIYWPAIPSTNIAILQSTTNLAAPNWVTANDAVPVTATTVSNSLPAKFFRLIYANPPTGMALIPAGSFTIGDTLDGEGDAIPTNIYVSGFYMDTNLVSYLLWQTIYSYATANGYSFVNAGAGKGTNYPVETVDWYDCVKWCNARSQLTGLTPVYYTDAAFTQIYTNGEHLPAGFVTVYPNWTANGFRLPTEAEWEKAARGGLSGRRFPWGNRIDQNQANYYGDPGYYSYDWGPNNYNAIGSAGSTFPNNIPYTTPVGSFDVNGYGLHDMSGNVFEWCWDWYGGTPYQAGSPYLGGSDPRGTGSASGKRVLRGGIWDSTAYCARCAYRAGNYPGNVVNDLGFRCVSGL